MNEPNADSRRASSMGADSGGAGAIGALAMFIALPLGAVTLAIGLHGAWRGSGALSFIVELVRDGGGFGLGVIVSSIVATIASAVMMSAALRTGVVPAPAAVLPFLFVLVVAMAGTKLQLGVITDVLPSAAPADRATILAAGISELMSLQLLSLAFCFGGAAAGVLACGAGLLHKDPAMRRASGVSAIGLTALAAMLVSLFMSSAGMRVGFSLVALVSPSDRLRMLLTLIEELRPWSNTAAFSALGVLGVAVLGGALLARGDRRSGIAVGASLLVALAGFRGTISVTDRMATSIDLSAIADPAEEQVLVFEGAPMPYAPMVYPARIEADELEDTLAGLEGSRDGTVQLWVDKQLTREQLVRALQSAQLHKLKVSLMGFEPAQQLPTNTPPMLRPFLELFNRMSTGAPIRVRFEGQDCKICAGRGVVTPSGLESPGGEMWKAQLLHDVPDESTLKVLDTEWKGSAEALTLAASAALSHGWVLEVTVPRLALESEK